MSSKPLRIECTVEVYGNTWEHREELRALGARWKPASSFAITSASAAASSPAKVSSTPDKYHRDREDRDGNRVRRAYYTQINAVPFND